MHRKIMNIDDLLNTRSEFLSKKIKLNLLIRICIFILITYITYTNIDSLQEIVLFIYILISFTKIIICIFCKKPSEKFNTHLKILYSISDFKDQLEFLNLKEEDLPVYTILIPLYKENDRTIFNLSFNISNLVYPKNKLDIKILCEEDDSDTINLVRKMNFQDILIVPSGKIKTKGRALNYGLKFAKGEYLTIYDAEDIPDKFQLLLVVNLFLNSQPKTIIQCALRYYNRVNWLSELMFAEYEYVFNKRNNVFGRYISFFPLGGTSNHFPVSSLININGWDAYNTTEDAEISILLNADNYNIQQMPVYTLEESVFERMAWIKQRSRWIKGYMQTLYSYFINMFCTKTFFIKPHKVRNISIFIYFALGIFIPFFCILMSMDTLFQAILQYSSHMPKKYMNHWYNGVIILITIMPIISEITLYESTFINSRQVPMLRLGGIIVAKMQIIIMFVFAYIKAVMELIYKPSYWDKTHHTGDFIIIDFDDYDKK